LHLRENGAFAEGKVEPKTLKKHQQASGTDGATSKMPSLGAVQGESAVSEYIQIQIGGLVW
jgi:hypothetical protein